MKIADGWEDYELLDLRKGQKLERWGKHILLRPDPQVIWNDSINEKYSKVEPSATYLRSREGGGRWNKNSLPESWNIKYKDLVFKVGMMGFKHTGLFPEQAYNWDYIREKINAAKKAGHKNLKVLNLFAYTGGATVAAASCGAEVVHLDSARGMVDWAKENAKLSGLENAKIRYIVDDAKKFVEREIRRGNKYDGIIMDPPSYGRGKKGEIWSFEEDITPFIRNAVRLLSDDPQFIIINSYTTGISGEMIKNILKIAMAEEEKARNIKFKGSFSTDEVGLKVKDKDIYLPAGMYTRWERNE